MGLSIGHLGHPWWLSGKDSTCNEGDAGSIPWRGKWQPTPVFLPGKSHGQEPGRLQSMGSQKIGHDWGTEQQQERCISSLPGFPVCASGKEPACLYRIHRRYRFDPWVGKIPWRRAWQPTPVFLPRKSHRQRSLVGYSPRDCKESNTTEATYHAQREKNPIRKADGKCLISFWEKEKEEPELTSGRQVTMFGVPSHLVLC